MTPADKKKAMTKMMSQMDHRAIELASVVHHPTIMSTERMDLISLLTKNAKGSSSRAAVVAKLESIGVTEQRAPDILDDVAQIETQKKRRVSRNMMLSTSSLMLSLDCQSRRRRCRSKDGNLRDPIQSRRTPRESGTDHQRPCGTSRRCPTTPKTPRRNRLRQRSSTIQARGRTFQEPFTWRKSQSKKLASLDVGLARYH